MIAAVDDMWRLGLDGFQLIRFRVGVQECGLIEGGRRRFVVNPAPAVPGHLASHLARCLFHDSVAQAPSPTCSPAETFAAVAATIRRAAGLTTEAPQVPWAAERPRLTEAWFCFAEPTASSARCARRRREAMRSLWASLELINNDDEELTRARSRDHH